MKIGLCGTMSVGKTTLVNRLKKLKQFEGYEFATERSKYLKQYFLIFHKLFLTPSAYYYEV